jgi:hypothetical protein
VAINNPQKSDEQQKKNKTMKRNDETTKHKEAMAFHPGTFPELLGTRFTE